MLSDLLISDLFFLFIFKAMQQVLDNLKELPSGTEAKDIDLIFLRGIIESPVVHSLAKARSWSTVSRNYPL